MPITQEDVNAALIASRRQWTFRHEVINPAGSVVGAVKAIGASVANNDLATKVKRTAKYILETQPDMNLYQDRLRSYAILKLTPEVVTSQVTIRPYVFRNMKYDMEEFVEPGTSMTNLYFNESFGLSVSPGQSSGVWTSAPLSLDGIKHVTGRDFYFEGAWQNIVMEVSLDNGQTWATVSGSDIPGAEDGADLTGGVMIVRANFNSSSSTLSYLDVYITQSAQTTTVSETVERWKEWPVGTFHLTTQGSRWATATGRDPLEVDAFDSLLVLDEDKVLDRYVVASGTNYRTAVEDVLESAGFNANRVATTDLTLPAAKEFPPGTSKLEIINTLLTAINFRPLVMDEMGVPMAQAYQDPSEATPVWEYTIDRKSVILPGIDVALDLFNVPNAWVATVSEPDRPPLTASKVNDDPDSLLSTVNRGRMIVQVIDSSSDSSDQSETGVDAPDLATLQAKVDRIAAEATQQYQHAEFDTGLMPFHGSGDVCIINYGEGPMRFRSHEWSMDLRAGGLMRHKFRRVVVV